MGDHTISNERQARLTLALRQRDHLHEPSTLADPLDQPNRLLWHVADIVSRHHDVDAARSERRKDPRHELTALQARGLSVREVNHGLAELELLRQRAKFAADAHLASLE